MSTGTYTITVTGPAWLNANDRDGHWGRRAYLARQWRANAAWAAKAAKVPTMGRARVVAVFLLPDRRRRDAHNLIPTAKACVDGLVDAGVLPDDSWQHLDGPDPRARIQPRVEGPAVELQISPADDAPDVFDPSVAPDGHVCGVCGWPTESEPCPEHQPRAYAEARRR